MFSLEFASTGLARTAASAGADFIVFDQEHTGWTTETIRQLLASARATDIAPLVRVPTSASHGIGIALALGALGVMVPMVNTRGGDPRDRRRGQVPARGRRAGSRCSTRTSTATTSTATCATPTARSRSSS